MIKGRFVFEENSTHPINQNISFMTIFGKLALLFGISLILHNSFLFAHAHYIKAHDYFGYFGKNLSEN